jgi:hypothetical protein
MLFLSYKTNYLFYFVYVHGNIVSTDKNLYCWLVLSGAGKKVYFDIYSIIEQRNI